MNQNRTKFWVRRRGVGTLELILALPVLLVVALAILQLGVQMLVRQTVVAAAHEGARAAARETTAAAARDAAVAAVNDVLAVHDLAVSPTASVGPSGSGVHFVLEFPTGAAVEVEEAGDSAVICQTPASPVLTEQDGDVRVTVCVAMNQPPLLNLLMSFGFDVTGQHLRASAMAAKE